MHLGYQKCMQVFVTLPGVARDGDGSVAEVFRCIQMAGVFRSFLIEVRVSRVTVALEG